MGSTEFQAESGAVNDGSYIVPFTEGLRLDRIHSICVMRLPWHIPSRELQPMLHALVEDGFLPLTFSGDMKTKGSFYKAWNYWPTDEFREVGKRIVLNSYSALGSVLSQLQRSNLLGTGVDAIIQQTKKRMFSGGGYFPGAEYQTVHDAKLVYCAVNKMSIFQPHPAQSVSDYYLYEAMLKKDGWSFISLNTEDAVLSEQSVETDLDFLFFPSMGSDRSVHAVVAEAFADRVPDHVELHKISNEEASRGGCNVADLARGKVLLVPNRADAQTYDILKEFSPAKLIETPQGYLVGGGGPRCLSSSFVINERNMPR